LSEEQAGNQPALTCAVFNADGTSVAILSGDQSVCVFRIFETAEKLIQYARHIVPRELTACERRRFYLPVKDDDGACPH
jgi:hypothetical protein